VAPTVQPPSQQATRHARRVYVGGLPPSANEQTIATFFSHALAAIGGNTAGPGNAVVNVYINREKNFAFVEFRTVEETSNAMALDGIMFEGVQVRVRRPNDYNPAAAASLGPSVPNPNLNLSAIGLTPGGVSSADSHDRIFVGGLPYYLTEDQCRELLGSFGPIKSFDLVKDRETGKSKGYGFVVYIDNAITDIACSGLNGLQMGDRTLTVRRATEQGATGAAPTTTFASMGAASTTLSGATPIVVLENAVTPEELVNPDEYTDILEDMREECSKYGQVTHIIIPRPAPDGSKQSGVGKVIIEFIDVNASVKARNAMHGRKFGGRSVVATYLPEEKFLAGDYD
jgi:splicing factor U2AF subunit